MENMLKILPLFKSHFSLGKSILTLESPKDKKGSPITNSIFHLLTSNNLDTLTLVEDNVSGLLQASRVAEENKIKLVFGLRIDITDDMLVKNEDALKRRAKYIIFARNPQSYITLSRLWSRAAKDGFYYTPCLDFKTLKHYWNKDLVLAVPFYDSFLELNTLHSAVHVPDIDWASPVFFQEDNDLPFDDIIAEKVNAYCRLQYSVIPAQSIFYHKASDFAAYMTFRCILNRNSNSKATLEKPELDHMGSDKFSFERWLKRNKETV